MKVGIIGCGSIARQRHAHEYGLNKNVEIAGFYDFVADRASDMVSKFGGKVYPTVEAMLSDKDIDLVSVCVANAYHAEITIKALKAGNNVLCEKPMAVTYDQCLEMVKTASDCGKRLFIGHNQRLTPAHRKAKELISSGKMGKVLTFATSFCHAGPESWGIDKGKGTWFFRKDAAAFGSMADLGIHKIDLIRYLVGDEIKSIYSEMCVLDKTYEDGSPIDVDDNSVEVIHFRNGAFGTVTTSWTQYGGENNQTQINCKNGVMKLYMDPKYSLVVTHPDGSVDNYDLDRIQTNTDKQQATSGVIDEVVDSILTGRKSILDADSIIGSMKAVFACMKSMETGKAVEI